MSTAVATLIEKLYGGAAAAGMSATATTTAAATTQLSPSQLSPFIIELLSIIDCNWNELQTHLPLLVQIHSQNQGTPLYADISLLLSKLHYHLGNWKQSVDFALLAGPLFSEASPVTSYHRTILFKAVDQYLEGCSGFTSNTGTVNNNTQLLPLINKLLANPLLNSEKLSIPDWKALAGFVVQSSRMDLLKSLLSTCASVEKLEFLLNNMPSTTTATNEGVQLISNASSPHSNRWDMALFHLKTLIILKSFDKIFPFLSGITDASLQLQCALRIEESLSPLEIALAFPFLFVESSTADPSLPESIKHALSGSIRRALHASAYTNNSEEESTIMDQILSKTKESLSQSSSMHISALSTSNAFAHLGTGSDLFLRENLAWFQHATNWTKYTTTASLGTINLNKRWESIRSILSSYLPCSPIDALNTSPYSEGGSLFSLGFGTFAQWTSGTKEEHSRFFIDFANEYMTSSSAENAFDDDSEDATAARGCDDFLHGCAMGLGAHFFQSHQLDLVDFLKSILYRDSSASAEGAAIAIGMVMFSAATAMSDDVRELLDELVSWARESQHERAQRGISMAIAMILYGSGSDGIAFLDDEAHLLDPIQTPQAPLRYGSCWALAMCVAKDINTTTTTVPQRLMRIAIGGDPSDEVKRASVMSLAFIMGPEDLYTLLKGTMLGNHNAHLRYGAAIALGIAFAGSSDNISGAATITTVLQTLKVMAQKDNTDFVRQASFLSLSMILQQRGPRCAEAKWIRDHMAIVLSSRYEDGVAKYGAILGQGIIDMGARRGRLSLDGGSGASVLGFMMFTNHWFFYPHALFLSLACKPTSPMLVGLNPTTTTTTTSKTSEVIVAPVREFVCSAPPSLFSTFPAPSKEKKEEVASLVQAVLSTTAKTSKMQVDDAVKQVQEVGGNDKKEPKGNGKDSAVAPAAEGQTCLIDNFGRATHCQIVGFVDGLESGINVVGISSADKFIEFVTDEISCWTGVSGVRDGDVNGDGSDIDTVKKDTTNDNNESKENKENGVDVKPPADFEFRE